MFVKPRILSLFSQLFNEFNNTLALVLYRLITDHEGFKSSAQREYDQEILQSLIKDQPMPARRLTFFIGTVKPV